MTVTLPTSGEIIGLLIEAFGGPDDLPEPVAQLLRDRTSRRLFRGASARRWCCRLTALQFMLVSRKLITLPEIVFRNRERSMGALSLVMMSETILWDELARDAGRRRAYLRYLVVDAASRLFGLLGEEACNSELLSPRPAWAERGRHGELVRALLAAVPGRNSDHAKALNRTASMVSAWKTGKLRPSVHSIGDLATYIGEHDPRGAAGVKKLLHWHYALAAVASAVAEVEGDDFVAELASVFTQSVVCKARRTRLRSDVSAELRLRLLVSPLWRSPRESRETLLRHAQTHGATDGWISDVLQVCAEYAALTDPDGIVKRNCPKHPHRFWHIPKPKRRLPAAAG